MRGWRAIRILALLLVLLFVALSSVQSRWRSTDWNESLWVGVYPIVGDDSATTQRYVDTLRQEHFEPLESFVQREAERYEVTLTEPIVARLGETLPAPPPAAPSQPGILANAWWSLRLRWWAWRATADSDLPATDIELFVIYHDPARSPQVPHSTGLRNGLVGVIHAFADRRMRGSNQVVIAHELFHVLGATDKYDLATSLPLYPTGYAEPHRQPRYPQRRAELMGGRIPLTPSRADIPRDLAQVRVGSATAREIRWLE